MVEFLRALILVLSTWLVLGLILTGLGLILRRCWGLRIQAADQVLTSFWLGWAALLLLLQLWHLYFKVDWRALVIVVIIGLTGLIWNWRDVGNLIIEKFRGKIGLFFLVMITAIWIATHAILNPMLDDSSLYHLQAVRWATSYPIVPGLGNLHSRLAFNSSYFLYVAMLEGGPWVHKSHHFANGLLMLILFMQIFLNAFRLLEKSNELQVYHLFNLFFLAAAIRMASRLFVASPSPDLPIFVLGIVLSSELLYFFSKTDSPPRENRFRVFLIIVLAAIGITIKLSFLILGGVALLLAIGVWFIKERSLDNSKIRGLVACLIVSLGLILLPWMIRGVILSGYIAYPSTIGAFKVDWLIPRDQVIDEANWIYSWARLPGRSYNEVLANWHWIKPWFFKIMAKPLSRFDMLVPLTLAIGSCVLALYYRVTSKAAWTRQGIRWLILLPPAASIIFWFLTAPDIRLAGSSFWILAAGSLALTIGSVNPVKSGKKKGFALLLALGLALIPLSRSVVPDVRRNLGFRAIPKPDLQTFTTRSGLLIYISQDEGRCWDAPLPCTPHPNAHLCLRKEGDLGGGFKLCP